MRQSNLAYWRSPQGIIILLLACMIGVLVAATAIPRHFVHSSSSTVQIIPSAPLIATATPVPYQAVLGGTIAAFQEVYGDAYRFRVQIQDTLLDVTTVSTTGRDKATRIKVISIAIPDGVSDADLFRAVTHFMPYDAIHKQDIPYVTNPSLTQHLYHSASLGINLPDDVFTTNTGGVASVGSFTWECDPPLGACILIPGSP